jgi:4-amino-4-deoxy-L-arabinose transferase-like glycosyltransferase
MTRRAEFAAAVLICLIGLSLRTVQIDYNFDSDEVFSAQIAAQPFGELIRQSLEDRAHPPLHNLLLSPWVRAYGSGEVSTRSFSVLCSAAFLIVAFFLLRKLMSPAPALGVLAILSVSPFFVYYGQTARPYSLLALISAVNFLAFVRLIDELGDRRRLLVWTASCAVLVWGQYFAVLTIAVEVAVLLPGLPRRNQFAVIVGGAMGVAAILPWLIAAMGGQLVQRSDPLTRIDWIERPVPQDLIWFFVRVFGDVPGVQTRWLLLPLTALAATFYAAMIRRGMSRQVLALTGIGLVIPLLVFALSFYGPKPVFVARQLIGSAFAFVVLFGLWVASRPRLLGGAALVGILGWCMAAAPSAFPVHSKPPWRSVAQYLDVEHPGCPVLVADQWTAMPLRYYRREGEIRLGPNPACPPVLVLCRPSGRADLLRSSPLQNWSWGRTQNPDRLAKLRLYEVGRDAN